jgi:hypothetical protein
MKLPKSFTTITPLSKAIALSMFIIFPVLAFCFGMYCQQLLDLGYTPQLVIEYKYIKPNPAPLPTQSLTNASSCQTNNDCPSGYYCAASGPLVYNFRTKKTSSVLTCHKKGTMVPL